MTSALVTVPALPVPTPRAAAAIGRWAAATLRWLAARPAQAEVRPDQSRLWALANRCAGVDRSLAGDLHAAVARWERAPVGR